MECQNVASVATISLSFRIRKLLVLISKTRQSLASLSFYLIQAGAPNAGEKPREAANGFLKELQQKATDADVAITADAALLHFGENDLQYKTFRMWNWRW